MEKSEKPRNKFMEKKIIIKVKSAIDELGL